FHDPNFTPPLQDGHHQRVDNSQRGHRQRQTPENPQEEIEHGKEACDIAGGIHDGESAEAFVFDGIFHSGHLPALGHGHHPRKINCFPRTWLACSVVSLSSAPRESAGRSSRSRAKSLRMTTSGTLVPEKKLPCSSSKASLRRPEGSRAATTAKCAAAGLPALE